jgi:hypothetical protein
MPETPMVRVVTAVSAVMAEATITMVSGSRVAVSAAMVDCSAMAAPMVARTAMMATVVTHAVMTAVMSTVVATMRSSIRRQRHQQCGHGCRYECKAPQQGFSPFKSYGSWDPGTVITIENVYQTRAFWIFETHALPNVALKLVPNYRGNGECFPNPLDDELLGSFERSFMIVGLVVYRAN